MATLEQKARKENVIKRLESQLQSGNKTEKKSVNTKVSLTDSDIKRIKKELDVLKSRI
jgi:hypothetical protein